MRVKLGAVAKTRARWTALAATLFLVLPVGPKHPLQSDLAAQAVDDPADGGNPVGSLEAVVWLTGCWAVESSDGRSAIEEHWMAPRGGLMVGMSRDVRNRRARGYELLTIRVGDEGHLVYRAAPSGQAVTDFTAQSIRPGHLEFANPAHDFPQKLVYSSVDEDGIEAAAFAEADGSEPAFRIPYRRVACPSGQTNNPRGDPEVAP